MQHNSNFVVTGQTVGDTAKALREEYKIADVLRSMTAVSLQRNGHELAGPCPKCGGVDRFYVTADGRYCACRQCHTQRMDVVGLVAWLHGVPQHEALDMLAGRRTFVRVRPPASSVTSVTNDSCDSSRPDASNSAEWRSQAAQSVLRACERLRMHTDGAQQARDYLLSRGLLPATWEAFSLGYDRARVPGTKNYAAAVSWPVVHEETGEVFGVRYRFLQTQPGADGKEHRYTSMTGSRMTGRLFGVPALPAGVMLQPDSADRLHSEAISCLVITEGEFNSMSVWQACHSTNVDILSFGSESQRTLPAWAVTLAQCYGAVVVWVDDPAKSLQVAQQLPQAKALRSVTENGVKLDANALLVAGQLGGLVQAARLSVMRARRESVLWQLWDSRHELDAGQVYIGRQLAQELGRQWTE